MAERKPLSKSIRFEVFKRDSFACQYCGSKAPDVILEVDHINPISNGGDNELMNLITACFSCNNGKSDKLISDSSIVEKQRKQIEELNLRRQQLEMMLKWRDENLEFKNIEAQKAIDYFNEQFYVFTLNQKGIGIITKHVKKYGIIKVLDAIDTSVENYYKDDDSFEIVLNKVGGILNIQSMPEYRQKISYIVNLCKNNLHYVNNHKMISILTEYHQSGYDLEHIIGMAKNGRFKNYSNFMEYIQSCISFEE